MSSIEKIIDIFLWVSLGMSLVQLYLRANKIWKRKHEREVADSQSIAGLSLLMLNCMLWLCSYVIKQDYESILDTSIIMGEATVFLLIGTGLWVKGQEKAGFWKLVRQALRMERKEADYLIKRFFRPANADKIISMLHQLAMIDNELDPKEKQLLESFSKEWNIEYSPEKLDNERLKGTSHNYIRLRKSLQDYLGQDPPHEQVAQLRDMMDAMIHADDKVTHEEALINSELMGIISNYIDADLKQNRFHVLIVPQKPEHEEVIRDLLPEAKKINVSGGIAYSIGSYYSHTYAEMICRQYQQIKLFTIVRVPTEEEEVLFGITEQEKN